MYWNIDADVLKIALNDQFSMKILHFYEKIHNFENKLYKSGQNMEKENCQLSINKIELSVW